MKQFEYLPMPKQWKEYFTAYPHGMTIFEAMCKWVEQTEDIIDNINYWNKYLDEFVKSFDKSLQQEVGETLLEWKESGFLEVIISEALLTQVTDIDERKVDNEIFFEVETKKYRHLDVTDYYITIVPSQYKPRIGIANNVFGTVQSTIDFARMAKATIAINAATFNMQTGKPNGVLIKDGEVLSDMLYDNENQPYILTIDDEGTLNSFRSKDYNASDILGMGYNNALQGWYPIIVNGVYLENRDPLNYQPIQVIGQTGTGDYVILTADGRTRTDRGMSMSEAASILLTYGVVFAYNLDGGGSTSTVNKMIKRNKNIDDLVEDRKVPTFLYFTTDSNDNNVYDAFAEVAKIKQELNDRIIRLTEIEKGFLRLRGRSGFHYPGVEFFVNGETSRLGKLECSVANGYRGTLKDGGIEKTVFQAKLDGLYSGLGRLANVLQYPQFITDCNKFDETGIFRTNTSTANTPISTAQGYLINFKFDGSQVGNCVQLFVGRDTPAMFYREVYAAGSTTSWVNFPSRATGTRPPADKILAGYSMFDTGLNKPIWWDGTKWVDSTGATV